MRKTIICLTGLMVGLAFLAQVAFAEQKLGYVDLSILFDEYGKTKKYDGVLEEKQASYESAREKRVNEVKQIQDSMNLLSEKERKSKESLLEKKINELRDFDRSEQQDLRKERDEKMKDILKDIEAAISQYAKQENFTLVFNDRVLVYQDKSLDITKEVLQILQKKYPAK
jgi:outer membrane protein